MGYKILSIDGGGIRGSFALQILKMLEEDLGKGFLSSIDCYAGTSTGALIIAAMSQGFKPKQILNLYTLLGSGVFPKKKGGKGAKYDNHFLAGAMKKIFSKNPTLADVDKHIIIPACNLFHEKTGNWEMEVYDNFDLEKAKKHSLIDVALRSSAAPIYFPSYQKCIDGGIYALNPSLLAFSRSIDKAGGNQSPSDISILSIGNGQNPGGIDEDINWDEKTWMEPYHMLARHPLFSLLTEMGAEIPDYPLRQIIQDRYLRINARLPIPVEIDDFKNIRIVIQRAKDLREKTPSLWDSYIEWAAKNLLQEA